MWVYDQSDGRFYHQINNADMGSCTFVAQGYSGKAWAKNNPKAENAKSMGPIPKGMWKIGAAYDSKNVGPRAIILEPMEGTRTYGRSAFRIHGDSIRNPGTASRGCIILPRNVRERIIKSSDKILRVVE